MRLHRVEIQNYKSIKNITVNFEPRCRVLLGINEAGKTNILEALSFLDPNKKADASDIREPKETEDFTQEAYIRFIFVYDKDDRKKIEHILKPSFVALDPSTTLVVKGNEKLSFSEFLERRTEILYIVDIKNNKRRFSYWTFPKNYKLAPGWKKPILNSFPADFSIKSNTDKNKQILLSSCKLIYASDFPDIPSEYLEDTNIEHISLFNKEIEQQIVTPQIPECIFWKYDEKNLLPGKISFSLFMTNPDTCLPLKHMFSLAGIEKITDTLMDAQNRHNGIRNILNRVASVSTKHMHKVWKEYKDISISLQQNGDFIDAVIKDKHNTYDMARRSDGFKRFITFLLLVSAKVKSEDLANTLYIHDEPEIHLHPSGAKYLRDELIRISEKNYVVYATHSIFMVDPNLPDRHLIVKKEDEITYIEEVNDSDVVDEEVLYNALDYSIFQNLSRKNIIFEGWGDKKLFTVAMSRIPSEYKHLQPVFSSIGKCHAKGAKDIGRVASMLGLGHRFYAILSDGDAPAKEQQAIFQKEFHDEEGPWFRYDELVKNVFTAEDFITPEAFLPSIKKLRDENPKLPSISIEDINNSHGRIATIQSWLLSNGVSKDDMKPIIKTIKDAVFTNLTQSQIIILYYEMLDMLATHFSAVNEEKTE